MKNKINFAGGAVAVAVLLFSAGCNDFLDKVPDNRTEIRTVEDVNKLLVTAYPLTSYASFLEMRCDGLTDYGQTLDGSQPTETFYNLSNWFAWDDYEQNPDNPDAAGVFWEYSYRAVTVANYALQAIEQRKLTGPEAALAKAEARIARAYSHFMLLSIFSDIYSSNNGGNPGIPYVTKPYEEVFREYERGTVSGTMEMIEKDLFEELPNIGTAVDYAQPKFHFNDVSAKALAVRIKLLQKDYPAVIRYANELILTPSKFTVNGTNTATDGSDRVFVDSDDKAYEEMDAKLQKWVDYMRGINYEATGQMYCNPEIPSSLLMAEQYTLVWRNFFGTIFSRFSYSTAFFNNMIKLNSTGGSYAISPLSLTGETCGLLPKFYEDFKYSNQAAGIGTPYTKMRLLSLEEVLLSRAEAYAMTGKYQEAINDLNIYFKNRIVDYNLATHSLTKDKVYAFYADKVIDSENYLNKYNSGRLLPLGEADMSGELQRAILLNILDIRRIEFLYEGIRYFDILRWNIPSHHITATGGREMLNPDDPRRIIQLPEATALANLAPNYRPVNHNAVSSVVRVPDVSEFSPDLVVEP